MQMSGLLKAFPPAELLQWAHNDRITGTLVVRRSSREKRVLLRNGKIVGCLSNERFEFYGQFLLAAGYLSEHQLLMALSHSEQSRPKPLLGEALVALGLLDEAKVVESLVMQTKQSVLDLFLWPRGVFFLLEDPPPNGGLQMPPLDPVGLVMDGVLQIDEMARIRERLPHDGVLLEPGRKWPGADLSHLATRIVGVFSPGKTLTELHDLTGGGYFPFIKETDELLRSDVFAIESLGQPAAETVTLSLLDLMLDRIHEERQATIGVTVGMPLAVFGQFYALWLEHGASAPTEDGLTRSLDFVTQLDGSHRLSEVLSADPESRDEQLEWLWLQIGRRRLVLLPGPINDTLRRQLSQG